MLQTKLSPQQVKQKNARFNEQRITSSPPRPIPMDIKLTSNPFLKDQEKFQYIVHQLKLYNKGALNKQINDEYQIMVYQKLYTMFTMLSGLNNRQVQKQRLDQIVDWYHNEMKLIEQRKDQGAIRYKVLKKQSQQQNIENVSSLQDFQQKSEIYEASNAKIKDLKLPSDIMAQQQLPYKKKWRTAHKQLEAPEKRLKNYKRKQLSVAPFADLNKQIKKAPRITYPKLEKIKWAKDDLMDEFNDAQKQLNELIPTNPESLANSNEGLNDPNNPENNLEKKPEEQQPGMDLGLGEPPQQPQQEEEEEPQEDKLAPKVKPYIYDPQEPTQEQRLSYQSMDNKYLKIQQKNIRRKVQDENIVNLMHSWALKKTQLNRQIHRRIENMGINMRYSFSYQEPAPIERINPQDEKKLGFSALYQTQKVMKPSLDMSGDFELPKINNKSEVYEKSIRKDRLKGLRKKFGKLLNLSENQPREEVSQTMCQYGDQRRGFSEILRKNSKSKERLRQLDEVIYLKEKLARRKSNIDMKSLSQALALPEDQDNLPIETVVSKDLLSNPFWVEPAKKKKKKK